MKFQIREQAAKVLSKRKKHSIYVLSASIAAVFTVVGVVFGLTRPGRAFSSLQKTLECNAQAHTHTAECYDAEGNLICGMADYFAHVHDPELCYDENGKVTEDGVDTVGIKIAGLRRRLIFYDEEQIGVTERSQYTSAAIPDWMAISGLSKKRGAIAIAINALVDTNTFYGERAITFYIAVSGGTEEQNEAAALSALDYIGSEVQKVPDLLLGSEAYYMYHSPSART